MRAVVGSCYAAPSTASRSCRKGNQDVTKLGVLGLLALLLGTIGCGGDDTGPPAGSGGTGGAGGTGGEDAQVPIDSGTEDAGPSELGALTIQLENIEGMQGKQVIVEVISVDTMASVAGACAQVTADPFGATLMTTTRNSPALCDYTADTQIGVGEYRITVQVQEPEVFPAILCADSTATVVTGETTTVTVDVYRSCTGGFPDGTYTGSSLTCSMTMQPLEYASEDVAVALLDFAGATVTAERNGAQWLETYEDSDCVLEVEREIISVVPGALSVIFGANRTYTWTPADCALSVNAGGNMIEVDSSSPLLPGSTDFHVDDVWSYTVTRAGFRFTTSAGVWSLVMPPLDVPCAAEESLVRTWMPL